MKKIFTILTAMILVAVSVFTMVGCGGDGNSASSKKGLSYKKEKDGNYVITSYKDDGTNAETLDIGRVFSDAEISADIRIKKNAFSGNTTLKEIIVPTDVVEIEEGAFANMTNLEKLTVPFVGKTIKADAYYRESEEAVDKSTDSARTIAHFFGTDAYDAGRPITINYGTGSKTCYVPYNFTEITVDSGENVYSIPYNAFNGATNLLKVTLKGTIDAIGEGAFMGATNLKEISMPKTVYMIYKNAFKDDAKLAKVFFEAKTDTEKVTIKEDAFNGAKKISYIGVVTETVPVKTVDLSMVKTVEKGAFDFGNKDVTYTVVNGDHIAELTNVMNNAFGETKHK